MNKNVQGVRPYKQVTCVPAGDGWAVMLDGKPALTPQRKPLLVPHKKLAEAIAAEFAAQPAKPSPNEMPMTQLACVMLDILAEKRDAVLQEISGYAHTDLLCYRAEQGSDLRKTQDEQFTSLLDWVQKTYGASFVVTEGIMPAAQPVDSVRALVQKIATYDDFTLAALSVLVPAAGSLLLGLAVVEKRITPEECAVLSQLEERYSLEHWGHDPALEHKLEGLSRQINECGQWLAHNG